MTRVCLTAEGQTEQEFAVRVLTPHLARVGVYLTKPRLAAVSRKRGMVHRGGLLRYEALRNDIDRWLKQDAADDVRFTTMFDLYALSSGFPGYGIAAAMRDKDARVASLEAAFAADVNDRRFIPYLQLHEFEAILFSDPSAFKFYYPGCGRKVEALIRSANEFTSPEWIDDGEQTAPSKRIAEQFPDYATVKRTAGPIIAERIGLEVIRKKCRHFNEWLTKLEQLGEKS